MHKNTGSMQN